MVPKVVPGFPKGSCSSKDAVRAASATEVQSRSVWQFEERVADGD
jgi:hypothetical protein